MKDKFKEKRDNLKKLLTELEAGQKKLSEAGHLEQAEADALDTKATEAEAIQKEIKEYDDRQRRLTATLESGRKIGDPIEPNDDQPDDEKSEMKDLPVSRALDGEPVAGYMSIGDYVVAQRGINDFVKAGMPRGGSALLANVPGMLRTKKGGRLLVPVSRKQVKEMMERKAVPTIGTDPFVIEPMHVPDIVRVAETDQLRLRDVLNIGTTTSDAVKYTRIVSYTRAAATVARSAQKPEAAMEIDAVTEPVRTVAVHMPVEEQQLSDYPALSGIINGELLYDVDKHVEELIMYGDGVGENFNGIIPDPAVLAARTVANDTLIDISRRGITDVRRAGYEPNGILADPLDWEDIVLEKGSDNRYVWVVVTEGATQRLWSVPVIETVAMEDFAGNETEARNLVVGDFARGATLWDRERSSISVGWINDQFIRNQRTILAELRAAFGVRRPGAFRKHETQEAVAS
jgi:HK97 family phage major capsid protein